MRTGRFAIVVAGSAETRQGHVAVKRTIYFHPMQLECWYVFGTHPPADVDATLGGGAAIDLAGTASALARGKWPAQLPILDTLQHPLQYSDHLPAEANRPHTTLTTSGRRHGDRLRI